VKHLLARHWRRLLVLGLLLGSIALIDHTQRQLYRLRLDFLVGDCRAGLEEIHDRLPPAR